ncbi:hypothetical protein MKX54_20050 [Alkalihalobacillus sp. FSL R5-0424]
MSGEYNLTSNVVELLYEWHYSIVSDRFKEANFKKVSVQRLIHDVNDYRLLKLYELVLSKHCLTSNNSNEEDSKPLHEDLLSFLLHDFKGKIAFDKNDYQEAVVHYRKAEKLLYVVKNNFERADFLKRLGFLYYRIDEILASTSYLKNAKDIFSLDSTYKLDELSCRLVVAGIYSEMDLSPKAEEEFSSILEESLFIEKLHSYALRAYGLHCIRHLNFKKAEEIFSTLLCEKTNLPVTTALKGKNKIDLANVLLKQNRVSEGSSLLSEANLDLSKDKDIEYIVRMNILYHLYVNHDLLVIDQQLNILVENNLLFEAAELALDVSYYFKQYDHYEQSLQYTELANRFKTKLKVILVDKGVNIA